MATNPLQGSAPRASSILDHSIQPGAPGKPGPVSAPATITSKAWVTLRRVFFTVDDVGAQKLYDVIDRLQVNILAVLGVVSTNALIPGNIIRSVAFIGATPQMVAHGLGRPWQGYICVRSSGTNPGLFVDVAYAPGTTADVVVPLQSNFTGTFDLYVF